VYWEGDVTIKGQINGAEVHGVGYTEINLCRSKIGSAS
jgi:hypothetical protein